MKSIDIKSFLIGLLSATCVFLLLGSSQDTYSKNNRYMIERDTELMSCYAVIDTYTGGVVFLDFSGGLKTKKEKPYFTGKEIRDLLENDRQIETEPIGE
jgi:hypothetical protein